MKAARAYLSSAAAGPARAVATGACVVLGAGVLAAGCGGIKAPDLFLVTRTPASPGGSVPTAGRRSMCACDRTQERSLTRAICPDQCGRLALAQGERHRAHRLE